MCVQIMRSIMNNLFLEGPGIQLRNLDELILSVLPLVFRMAGLILLRLWWVFQMRKYHDWI